MYLSKKQILITGVYRSGTEYFSFLLNQHPNISSTMYRINALRFMYGKYGTKKINHKKLIDDLSVRLKKRYNYQFNKKKYYKLIKGKNYGEIYDILMSNFYLKKNKTIWAEKNQLLWTKSQTFLKDLPNPYVIHILRDPRNVMASFKNYTNSKYPAYLTSIFNSLDAMQNILKNKNNKRFLYIRYEDLLLNPTKILDKVQNFLKIKRYNLIKKNNNFSYFGKKWIVNSSFQNKIKKVNQYNKNVSFNSYKKNLNFLDLILVEKICGKLMEKFKYKLELNNHKIQSDDLNELLNQNKLLKQGYENWKKYKIGFEKFPNDPINSNYWDKKTI